MDKFVIRIPRGEKAKPKTTGYKFYKQTTIDSLKGVIFIEDLEKAKVILERDDVSAELKVNTLETLLVKLPCKEVLVRTKLGKTIHKMCRHPNLDVASASKKVYKCWRDHIVHSANRRSIEVQYDARTQQMRERARTLILKELGPSASCSELFPLTSQSQLEASPGNLEKLAECIEREVFKTVQNKTTDEYKRINRRVIFALKYQKELKEKVLDSTMLVQELVKHLSVPYSSE